MRIQDINMSRGLTKTKLSGRYSEDFLFPEKGSPYIDVLKYTGKEMCVIGPAGTGKSHMCVMRGHKFACNFPGSVGVFVRKVSETIKRTICPTFAEVLGYDPLFEKDQFVQGFGGTQPQEYRYRNGSIIYLIGMNDRKQLDSLQADWAYVNQGDDLEEGDWEILTARTRRTAMPYNSVFTCVNPSYPEHFFCPYKDNPYRRQDVFAVETRHIHNPLYYRNGKKTERGVQYIDGTLMKMTGMNYKRYYEGLWCAPEGAVFHLLPCHIISTLPWDLKQTDPRFQPIQAYNIHRALDFGTGESPSTCIWFAKHKQSRDVIVAREWRRLGVDTIDQATAIKRHDFSGVPVTDTIIDADANLQSILYREGIPTKLAKKGQDSVKAGLDEMQVHLDRAEKGENGGLYFYSNLEVGQDNRLSDQKRPTNCIQETRLLRWHTDVRKKDPIGEDHGIDPIRYHLLDNIVARGILDSVPYVGGIDMPMETY